MIYGAQGLMGGLGAYLPAAGGHEAGRTGSAGDAFAGAMAGAWAGGTLGTLGFPAASLGVSSAASAGTVSAWGHTEEVPGTTLEEMLRNVHPQLTYHVMDCSSSNWIRNDFPHYKLFQSNVSAAEIENWQPSGEEPTQANSPACHALSRVAPGSVAVVIHPTVQAKMEEDPEYAREIFERIEAWFAFDEVRNAAIAAGHGDSGSGITKRAIAIGEDGLITNAMAAGEGRLTFSSSGGTGRTGESWWDARIRRHHQQMEELVKEQIGRKQQASAQLTAMSSAASARQQFVSMTADPALRAALGESIGGIPLDTVFDISMQHIQAAAGFGF